MLLHPHTHAHTVKELALESRRIYSHLQLSSENPDTDRTINLTRGSSNAHQTTVKHFCRKIYFRNTWR